MLKDSILAAFVLVAGASLVAAQGPSAENRAADTPGPLPRPELLPSTPVRQLHARRLRKYERRLRE